MPELLTPDAQDTSAFLNPALVAEAERIARRKAELRQRAEDAARQVGVFTPAQMVESPGFTSAVTGTRVQTPSVKPGKWARFAPLAQQALLAFEKSNLNDDVSGYTRMEAEASRRHLLAKPADDAPTADKLAWAQAGAQIPALKPVMDAYVKDELTEAPARRAKLEFDQKKFRSEENRKDVETFLRGDQQWETARHNREMENRPAFTAVVNPLTGDVSSFNSRAGTTAPSPGGQGAGTRAAPVVQQELDAQSKVKNAREALRLLSDVDGLIGTATSSGMGTLRDQVYGFFGKSTPAGDAAGELQNVAAKLLAFADKSGLGPQFSDADRKFLESASSGGIGDPAVPESRKRATLARIRSNLEYAAGGSGTPPPSRSASGKVTDDSEPVPGSSILRQPKSKPEPERFKPQQRESFGQQLMEEWKAASPDQRGAIEQRALSVGATFNGRPYRGGAFNSREAWGEK